MSTQIHHRFGSSLLIPILILGLIALLNAQSEKQKSNNLIENLVRLKLPIAKTESIKNAEQQTIAFQNNLLSSMSEDSEVMISKTQYWQPTNGPYAGIIYSIVVAPNGNLFAADYKSGIFLSTNNGDSWINVLKM